MTLEQLKQHFETATIPGEIVICGHIHIKDTAKFIKGHVDYLENNPGNRTFLPYYERLLAMYKETLPLASVT
jgi:hypothetical protein